ncbi:MAG: superoxide dismutase family protein [Syntrophobacterales bacterium]
MKKMLWILLGLFLLEVLGCGGGGEKASQATSKAKVPKAEATLVDSQGKEVGKAMLEETDKGVKITLDVENLPPGEHAFHIHEKGTCDPPDFKTAGGHFNPYGKEHGLKNPKGPHAGDLPNNTIGPDGRGHFEIMATLVTLKSGEKNSLFQPGGTSLMIHQGPDDYVSDPAGNAGPRIACGPIVKKSP